jgi:hypothetical protein
LRTGRLTGQSGRQKRKTTDYWLIMKDSEKRLIALRGEVIVKLVK